MVVYFFGFGNFLYPFLLGLLGGHDAESLAQIEFAARHSGPSKPFALAFYRITALGSRLSPFHGKHPIPYDEAAKEAGELFMLVKQPNTKEQ